MSENLPVPVPLFIDVTDVMRSMKCSRSRAYQHMRAALGRRPGDRGQSRVPLYVWERYVRRRFDPEVRANGEPGAPAARSGTGPGLRVTRPRTTPRLPEATPTVLRNPRVSDDPAAC